MDISEQIASQWAARRKEFEVVWWLLPRIPQEEIEEDVAAKLQSRITACLLMTPFHAESGKQVGLILAQQFGFHLEKLVQLQQLLAEQLLRELDQAQVAWLAPRLISFWAAMTVGFGQAMQQFYTAEQATQQQKLLAEFQQLTAQVRESEERFAALFEGSAQPVFLHENGRILTINHAITQTFGYTVQDLVGEKVQTLIQTMTIPTEQAKIIKQMEGEQERPYFTQCLTKKGTAVAVEAAARQNLSGQILSCMSKLMKLAISGKGGVGKTTLAALLAQAYADAGQQVLAVDADPSPCLAGALGFPAGLRAQLHPIVEMDELIAERTGARPGSMGGFFTLNPRVDDIPERFSVVHRGVRLLEMGAVELGGSGCICPESAMLKTLFTHLLFRKDDVLILDMYAGVEHLGRATVDFVDALLIVVEPTRRSLGTAMQIKKLAQDIGLERFWLVGNKVQNEAERAFLQREAPDLPLLGVLPMDPAVLEADRLGLAVYDHVPALRQSALQMAGQLDSLNN